MAQSCQGSAPSALLVSRAQPGPSLRGLELQVLVLEVLEQLALVQQVLVHFLQQRGHRIW